MSDTCTYCVGGIHVQIAPFNDVPHLLVKCGACGNYYVSMPNDIEYQRIMRSFESLRAPATLQSGGVRLMEHEGGRIACVPLATSQVDERCARLDGTHVEGADRYL
nr:hypothetical protein [Delftia tsuruhatensis]